MTCMSSAWELWQFWRNWVNASSSTGDRASCRTTLSWFICWQAGHNKQNIQYQKVCMDKFNRCQSSSNVDQYKLKSLHLKLECQNVNTILLGKWHIFENRTINKYRANRNRQGFNMHILCADTSSFHTSEVVSKVYTIVI